MNELIRLPNIGIVLAKKLVDAGITSFVELVSIGSIGAMCRIRSAVDSEACYNTLYALEGAIRGVRWHGIPREERTKLKDEFDRVACLNT
jgi:DNA transformation protein